MDHEISLLLSDNNTDTCVSFGQSTSFSNYSIMVLKIDNPSATPLCPKMYFKVIYDEFLDEYKHGLIIYTSTSEDSSNAVRRMTYCRGSQVGNNTDGLSTKLYSCSCPVGCSIYIQIGSKEISMAKRKYKICEATSILSTERM